MSSLERATGALRTLPYYSVGEIWRDGKWRSWERERREVLESIGEELKGAPPGPAAMDACLYLLDHLLRTRAAQDCCRSS